VPGGSCVILSGDHVTKYSKLYKTEIRRQLRGLHQAIQNIQVLSKLYDGSHKNRAPFSFRETLGKIFDTETFTARTSSLRHPSPQGVQEWRYEEFATELECQFQQGFRWELLNVEVLNSPRTITFLVRAVNADTDVTFLNTAYVQDGMICRIERQRTNYEIQPLIENLEAYFQLFSAGDRTNTVPKDFTRRFDAIYDTSAVSLSKQGLVSRDLMHESCIMLLERGAQLELTGYRAHEKGLSYTVKCRGQGHAFTSQSLAIVEQGRIVRVEPLKKKDTMYSKVAKKPVPEEFTSTMHAMENLKKFFGLYQGKRKIPTEFQGLLEMTFDPLLAARVPGSQSSTNESDNDSTDETLDYRELREEFAAHFRSGLTMKIIEMARVAPGLISYTIQAFNAIVDFTFRSLAQAKDGKIVRLTRQGTHYSIFPLLKSFRDYVALFADDRLVQDDWQERLDALFSKNEITIETGEDTIDYNRICASVPHFLERRGQVHLRSLERQKKGGFEYTVTYETDEYEETVKARAVVYRGQIVRIDVLENGLFYENLYRYGKEEDEVEGIEPTEELTETTYEEYDTDCEQSLDRV
jgi:hypothetical protein